MPRRTQLLFLVAVLVQLAILAVFPLEKAYVRARGETVFLALHPVDPYDVLSGYYQTLRYTVSDPSPLAGARQGDTVYVLLRENDRGLWPAVSYSEEKPSPAGEGEAVLRGELEGGILRFGIETFFFPEKDRQRLNRLFAERLGALRAEVRVTGDGRAALVGIWVADEPLEDYLRRQND